MDTMHQRIFEEGWEDGQSYKGICVSQERDGEQFYDEPQNKQIKVEQSSDTYEKHHYNTIKIKD